MIWKCIKFWSVGPEWRGAEGGDKCESARRELAAG